jgi:hypothetical protein
MKRTWFRRDVRRSILLLFSSVFVLVAAGWSEADSAKLSKAYIGQDGLAHVITEGGEDRAIPKADGQVAVADPKLAPDDRTAGWLIEQDNCCTSYPIPTRIGIYRDGKTILLNSGLMVYSWNFRNGGKQVVASIGTVHGMELADFVLFDSRIGKVLKEWSGASDQKAPEWTKDLGVH